MIWEGKPDRRSGFPRMADRFLLDLIRFAVLRCFCNTIILRRSEYFPKSASGAFSGSFSGLIVLMDLVNAHGEQGDDQSDQVSIRQGSIAFQDDGGDAKSGDRQTNDH